MKLNGHSYASESLVHDDARVDQRMRVQWRNTFFHTALGKSW